MRLDKWLSDKKICRSRSNAADLIKRGFVLINSQLINDASHDVSEHDEIVLLKSDNWPSRAAEKLAAAFSFWKLDVSDDVCLDVGASTGGFTAVLLSNHAKKVYAVDVGHNQLVAELRNNSRVINMEGINVRYGLKNFIFESLDFACVDVSFISLKLVLPSVIEMLKKEASLVVLIKPQFELGPESINKKGLVTDPLQYDNLKLSISQFIDQQMGVKGTIIDSPILGGDGNREFLGYWTRK